MCTIQCCTLVIGDLPKSCDTVAAFIQLIEQACMQIGNACVFKLMRICACVCVCVCISVSVKPSYYPRVSFSLRSERFFTYVRVRVCVFVEECYHVPRLVETSASFTRMQLPSLLYELWKYRPVWYDGGAAHMKVRGRGSIPYICLLTHQQRTHTPTRTHTHRHQSGE